MASEYGRREMKCSNLKIVRALQDMTRRVQEFEIFTGEIQLVYILFGKRIGQEISDHGSSSIL
jgi:hypothetical protein